MQAFRRRKIELPNWLGRSLPARFVRNEDGVYAIEFAMVAMPFFALLFMIFEVSFTIFANQILDNAVSDAARMIRTGQAQQQNFSQAEFKQQVCGGLVGLFDCDSYLHIDVKTFSSFGSVALSEPTDENGDVDDGSFSYNDGGANDIVVVRVFYEWPMISPLSGSHLADLSNGRRLLSSVAAFRNEPFPW
ncbi:MAG: pilus assembly protein [Hyphomicrobiales bacterium]|nr:MAG: pilus assembly protein [Hyphomicrobiales bacterium]